MKLLCWDNELQTMKGTIPSNPFLTGYSFLQTDF